MRFWRREGKCWSSVAVILLLCGLTPSVYGQPAASAQPPDPPPSMTAPLDVKAANPPSTQELSQGDPGGTKTGTISDIVATDATKGPTLADSMNQVGQNRIAINFVWTLVTGFLVMFMQAGFAIVETGLCRAKNANHTMMMNFMVYGFGLFAFWVCGFAIQMGGGAPYSTLGGINPLNSEHTLNLLGKTWGVWGTHGFFLTQGHSYDVGVMVLFLFQMVFMDTALTIVTGAAAERWKYVAFSVSSIFMGAFTYPLFANWAWGGGWLSQLGGNFGLGHGYCDFAGSGVVHAVGGVTALVLGMIIGPRIGKFTREGKPNPIAGHDITLVLTGCFILAFGWFGFNPGSTLAASGNGALRIGSVAVNTMLAGATGSFGALFYMWIRYRKPDASMTGNGLLAGLVAITAPSGFVSTIGSAIIGLIAGVLVCVSVEFFEKIIKVDDPVGAISVHGVNGIWGVISVGLFADGTSNYGGSWNGVTGSVRGLFYGDPSQLVAQLIGVSTLVGFVFAFSYVANWLIDIFIGQRVSAEDELDGLDIPEMGALAYPDFALNPER
jgi:ammonium transporter, Amt family